MREDEAGGGGHSNCVGTHMKGHERRHDGKKRKEMKGDDAPPLTEADTLHSG